MVEMRLAEILSIGPDCFGICFGSLKTCVIPLEVEGLSRTENPCVGGSSPPLTTLIRFRKRSRKMTDEVGKSSDPTSDKQPVKVQRD